MAIGGVVAQRYIEIHPLEFGGDGAGFSVRNGPAIKPDDRRQMSGGSAEENFVRQVEFASVDRPHLYVHFQFDTRQLHDGVAGDATQRVVLKDGGKDPPVFHHEDIFRCTFGYVAIVIQQDRFVEAVDCRLGLGEDTVEIDGGGFHPSTTVAEMW